MRGGRGTGRAQGHGSACASLCGRRLPAAPPACARQALSVSTHQETGTLKFYFSVEISTNDFDWGSVDQ